MELGTAMTVKIVTDSVADLPSQVVKGLGITVIPIIIRWGEELYRLGIWRDYVPRWFPHFAHSHGDCRCPFHCVWHRGDVCGY